MPEKTSSYVTGNAGNIPLFNIRHIFKGIRLITRLRLGLIHLREHKLKYNFQNCLNQNCLI